MNEKNFGPRELPKLAVFTEGDHLLGKCSLCHHFTFSTEHSVKGERGDHQECLEAMFARHVAGNHPS